MNDLEGEVERRTVTYTLWNRSLTTMESQSWHPFTFGYENAGTKQVQEIKASLVFHLLTIIIISQNINITSIIKLNIIIVCRAFITYTMRLSIEQSGAAPTQPLFLASCLLGSSLVGLPCVY